LSLMAPSLNLSPHYDDLVTAGTKSKTYPYPFSVAPDEECFAGGIVERQDFFRIMRDTYAGTEFDLGLPTKCAGMEEKTEADGPGLGGPFGSVDRYDNGHPAVKDAFERPIGISRMKYSYVVEAPRALGNAVVDEIGISKDQEAVLWFAPHVSVSSVYFPVPQSLKAVPAALGEVTMRKLDRRSAYWACRFVKHLALMRWDRCFKLIQERQVMWEEKAGKLLDRSFEEQQASQKEADFHDFAAAVVAEWWTLGDELITRFGDGWDYDGTGALGEGQALGYPEVWLTGSWHSKVLLAKAPPERHVWSLEGKQGVAFNSRGDGVAHLEM